MEWSPFSWKSKVAAQEVEYPDPDALEHVVQQMSSMPPLVTSWEVESLKEQLAAAGRGEAFLLQGGDCAESFDDCQPDPIASKFKILLQMSLVLVHGTRKPVIRVGRIAGQYAKPRSANTETRDDVTLPSYRGDLVNRTAFTREDRVPDPNLLLKGYERAALTLNFIRGLAGGGFADLHHPEFWNLTFAEHSELGEEYQRVVDTIRDSIGLMETITGKAEERLRRVEVFTSHEALSLNYEAAQTRRVPRREGWYNLSCHLPWIGMRTAAADGAHVEYCRGITNPVGVKVGPTMTAEWLTELIETLNPNDEPGRLMLIHRLGASKVKEHLPKLIEVVQKTGKQVVWCSDPMHGNTETTSNGIKTRRFDNILSELEQAFEVHAAMGSNLGGVHFEMTGEDVTECLGGARGLSEEDLTEAYKSAVDPRLNYEQALELALLVARRIRNSGSR